MEFTLHCGNTTARVRQKGAQMTSFKGNDNREVIWQADPAVWGNHAPVLFPICGTAKDNHVIIDGVSYPIAKHGFSRNPEFTVEKIGDDFIELVLTPTEESKPSYPFEFAFHVVYTLRENGFSAQFLVENKSDKVMPFCCGGHPGFIVPMEEAQATRTTSWFSRKSRTGATASAPADTSLTAANISPASTTAACCRSATTFSTTATR